MPSLTTDLNNLRICKITYVIHQCIERMTKYKFELDETETQKFEDWKKQQKEKDPHIPTAGERWTFMFTPTGLGTVVEAKDNLLKEKIDLTDWDTW